eukprot:TRINITY_DN75153_c0_g1_i1.p1 TRINITY_DN75153_c0_g1~~TRINITY_DN75153_c0_g1_i1.p1  ORF type:complete len:438 (+),score=61.50 TRINITY_DN75153_c0_g1_i1:44-1357(+)
MLQDVLVAASADRSTSCPSMALEVSINTFAGHLCTLEGSPAWTASYILKAAISEANLTQNAHWVVILGEDILERHTRLSEIVSEGEETIAVTILVPPADPAEWLSTIEKNWRFLKKAPLEIRDAPEIALVAVRQEPSVFKLLGENARSSCEVAAEAVQHQGELFEYVVGEARLDRHVVLLAVRASQAVCGRTTRYNWYSGGALQHAAEFHNDREVVLAAVARNGAALQYASEELRGDPEVARTALQSAVRAMQIRERNTVGYVFAFVTDALRADREFVVEFLRSDATLFDRLPIEMRADFGLAMLYVSSHDNPLCIELPDVCWSNRDIAMQAVQRCGMLLGKVCNEFRRTDREIVLAAVRCHGKALQYAIDVKAKGRSTKALRKAAELSLRGDKEIALCAVQQDPEAFKFIAESLWDDPDIVMAVGPKKVKKNTAKS